jgi:YgiT-type zinc finger domain-containing protein
MTSDEQDPVRHAQRVLASWHATHPDATFAEIEQAVEAQLDQIRTQFMGERMGSRAGEGHPVCPHCGGTMRPQTRRRRQVVLRGDQTLDLERDYLVCPSCGEGFFPPR